VNTVFIFSCGIKPEGFIFNALNATFYPKINRYAAIFSSFIASLTLRFTEARLSS
jgi:hypothetical protein